MGMNAAELALVMAEARPALEGGRIQRVDQPGAGALCLTVRRPGSTAWLFCSTDAQHARLHLAPGRVHGEPPRRFGQYLRKHIEGARVVSARQTPGDRIVELALEGSDTVGRLVFEVTGRNANVIAVDAEGRIADALRHVAGERRRILPGESYAPPAGAAPAEPPAAAPEALAAPSPSEHFRERYERLEREADLERRRRAAAGELDRSRRRLESLIEGERAAASAAAGAEALRRQGELLKAHLHGVPAGAKELRVQDFFDAAGGEATIPLEPRLSARENMERLFQRARKLERGLAEARRRAAEARQELARLAETRRRLGEAGSAEELAALAAEAAPGRGGRGAGAVPAGRQAEGGSAGPRRFQSADGWEIVVGRNAAENDRLTLRWARGNDLWLHVRGMKGSHVVVPAPAGKSVPGETLVDAATLAAFYSEARGRLRVEVDYTPVKHVRKPRKAPPGAVTLEQHKTLALRVEAERLRRLLGG